MQEACYIGIISYNCKVRRRLGGEGVRQQTKHRINKQQIMLSSNLREETEAVMHRVTRGHSKMDAVELVLSRNLVIHVNVLGDVGYLGSQPGVAIRAVLAVGGVEDPQKDIHGYLRGEFVRAPVLVQDEVVEGVGWLPDLRNPIHVDEAAPLAIWASSDGMEGFADLGFEAGGLADGAKVVNSVSKLALDAILASPCFLKRTAQFGLVQFTVAVTVTVTVTFTVAVAVAVSGPFTGVGKGY